MKIDLYIEDYEERKRRAEAFELSQKNVEKIKKIALKIVRYPEFGEAYDYVDNLFPGSHVKDVAIYRVAALDLEKMGYAGVEGFYDKISKIIVICGSRRWVRGYVRSEYRVEAKVSSDEVIVHELLHYAYIAEGRVSNSRDMNEEFAYGWSLGYLRQKDYSNEYIIKYNFLPYLIGVCYTEATHNILVKLNIPERDFKSFSRFRKKEFNRSYGGKVFLRAKELAMERGQKLIDMYSEKLKEGGYTEIEEESDRFSIMDFGDHV